MSDKEIYVYLDLNGRLDHNFFQKEHIHFKMVNIHTDNPLVQIGNYVFQGSYEDFLGTKVFFMEDKNHESNENVFIKETPIHLKYTAKTGKVLQLKWRKIPTNIVHIDKNECTDLQFTHTYNEVLKKLEKGALNIRDIIYDAAREGSSKVVEQSMETDEGAADAEITKTEEIIQEEENSDKSETQDFPVDKYKLLKELAQQPTQPIERNKLLEIKKEELAGVEDASNFAVLKQLFIQNITFKNEILKTEDNEFNKYVDVRKSLEDGVISPIKNKELTNEQRCLLLNSSNFDNFSLPMKLAYLTEQLEEYKRLLSTMERDKLQEPDEFDRTFGDRYRLLKRVTKEIWYYVYTNYAN